MQGFDKFDWLMAAVLVLLAVSGVVEYSFGARRLAQGTWFGTLVLAVFVLVSLLVR
jgi:uncharacterized membrane protein